MSKPGYKIKVASQEINLSDFGCSITQKELPFEDFQASQVPTDVVISFPLSKFYDLMEDVEDIAFLAGYDIPEADKKDTTSHKDFLKEMGIKDKE